MSAVEKLLCPLCDHPFLVKEAFYKHVPSCFDIQVKAWEKAPVELRGPHPELPPHFQDLVGGPRWHDAKTHIANVNTDGTSKRPTAGGRSTRIERSGPKPPPALSDDAMLASTRAAASLGPAPKNGHVPYDDAAANEWLRGRIADAEVQAADSLAASVTARTLNGSLPTHQQTLRTSRPYTADANGTAPGSFRGSTGGPGSPSGGSADGWAGVSGGRSGEGPAGGAGGATSPAGTAASPSSTSLPAFGTTHTPMGYKPVPQPDGRGSLTSPPRDHASLHQSPTATFIRGQTLASLNEVGVVASPTNHPFIKWERSPQWFTHRNECPKCRKFFGPYNPRSFHAHLVQCCGMDVDISTLNAASSHAPHSRFLSGPSTGVVGAASPAAPAYEPSPPSDEYEQPREEEVDPAPRRRAASADPRFARSGGAASSFPAGSPRAALKAWRGGVRGGGIYDNVGAARSDRVAWRVRPTPNAGRMLRSHAAHVHGPLRGGSRAQSAGAAVRARRSYPFGLATASGPGAAAAIDAAVNAHNNGVVQPVAVAGGGGGAMMLKGTAIRGPNDPRDVLCSPKMSTCGPGGRTAGPAGAAGAGFSTKESLWAPGATSPGSRRGQRFVVEGDGHVNSPPSLVKDATGGAYGVADGSSPTGGVNSSRPEGSRRGPFTVKAVGDVNVCSADPCNMGSIGHLFKRCDFCGTSLHISALAPHVANCMARPTATPMSPSRRPARTQTAPSPTA